MKTIILASASPRRKELLSQIIGNDFLVCTSSYDEFHIGSLTPEELVRHHSLEKARDVAKKYPDSIVISADTVIVLDNEILGKPDSADQARIMLRKLSGRKMQAITGLTLLDVGKNEEITESEITYVWMKELSEDEIEAYIRTEEPFGKAGSFAIQGLGALLIEKIEGDFFNVVGLPLFRLGKMLERTGITVLK
ncbi:Maf family nucleotide pyrophosphatase [Methanolobus sp. ZRKC3]|uniref:Maf family nucleotide pyrophosphatase n=1 Tax=Methanolobus sp. ZRKC3 TaxID=3125786 RepID=UPI0032449C92